MRLRKQVGRGFTAWLVDFVLVAAIFASGACGTPAGQDGGDDNIADASDNGQDATGALADDSGCGDGQACDDGDPCTAGETCKDGKCSGGLDICECRENADCSGLVADRCHGQAICEKSAAPYKCKLIKTAPPSCSTTAVCTVSACDPATGECQEGPAADHIGCDDGLPCTVGDHCKAGKCAAGTDVCSCKTDTDCETDGGNPCDGSQFCDKTALPWRCAVNKATVVSCSGATPACKTPGCDPKTGKCFTAALKDGTTCDDGKPCTASACEGGTCKSTGVDTCKCKSAADCLGAEDGDACNGSLYCDQNSGACKVNPATVVSCPAGADTACSKNVCFPKTGACNYAARKLVTDKCAEDPGKKCAFALVAPGAQPDAGPFACEDGDACTKGDVCDGDTCKAGTDACGCSKDEDCKPQEDGNQCNGTLFCNQQNGKCELNAATKVVCKASDDTACTKAACKREDGTCAPTPIEKALKVCDVTTGASKCRFEVLPKGAAGQVAAPCDDGDKCTAGEVCEGGTCGSGTFVCSCKTDADCAQLDDGDKCNGGAFCNLQKGACEAQGGSAVVCPSVSDTACVKNACVPKTGACVAVQTGKAKKICGVGSDSKACRWVTQPQGAPTVAVDCEDGNPCTAGDQCDGSACKPGKMACACWVDADCAKAEDGNPCNGTLYCDKSGKVPVCQVNPASVPICAQDTGSPCLTSVCDPKTDKGDCKAVAGNNGGSCDDGDACTDKDACAAGKCAGKPLACDDKNACTTDSCDKKLGCQHKALSCNDYIACTLDTCDPTSGKCSNSAAPMEGKVCDADGDGCTTGDACKAGKCVVGSKAQCAASDQPCAIATCLSKGPLSFSCTASPKKDGSPCDDPKSCFKGGNCSKGTCAGGTAQRLFSATTDGLGEGVWHAVAAGKDEVLVAGYVKTKFSMSASARSSSDNGKTWKNRAGWAIKTADRAFTGVTAEPDGSVVTLRNYNNTGTGVINIERWGKDGKPSGGGPVALKQLPVGPGRLHAQSDGGYTAVFDRYNHKNERMGVGDLSLTKAGSLRFLMTHMLTGGARASAMLPDDSVLVGGWLPAGTSHTMAYSHRSSSGSFIASDKLEAAPAGQVIAIAGRADGTVTVVGVREDPAGKELPGLWHGRLGINGKIQVGSVIPEPFAVNSSVQLDGGHIRLLGALHGVPAVMAVDEWGNKAWTRSLGAAKGTLRAGVVAPGGGVLVAGAIGASGFVGRLDDWGHATCAESTGCNAFTADDCDDGKPCTRDVCEAGKGCDSKPQSGRVCAGSDGCVTHRACAANGQCTVIGQQRLTATAHSKFTIGGAGIRPTSEGPVHFGLDSNGLPARQLLTTAGPGAVESFDDVKMQSVAFARLQPNSTLAVGMIDGLPHIRSRFTQGNVTGLETRKVCDKTETCTVLDAVGTDGDLAALVAAHVTAPTNRLLVQRVAIEKASTIHSKHVALQSGWKDPSIRAGQLPDGELWLVGNTLELGGKDRDAVVILLSAQLSVLLQQVQVEAGERSWSAAVAMGDDLLLAGQLRDDSKGPNKLVLQRMTRKGAKVWERVESKLRDHEPLALETTSDGGFVLAGLLTEAGKQKLFVQRRSVLGALTGEQLADAPVAAGQTISAWGQHPLVRMPDGDWVLAARRKTAAGTEALSWRVSPWGHGSCENAGKCAFLTLAKCDDGQSCSADHCDPKAGCQHATVGCDDGKACTEDSCDKVLGCQHVAAQCNDNNPCTVDGCGDKGCVHAKLSCDDNNACTADTCANLAGPQGGCQHAKVDCSDGNVCTQDSCHTVAGCQHINHQCEDGNSCTADSCDAKANACKHVALKLNALCEDGNLCTSNDLCDGLGTCKAGKFGECDDGNSCTKNTCKSSGVCVAAAIDDGKPCAGSACVLKAQCDAGKCTGAPKCDDNNLCTDDSCAPDATCTNKPHNRPCDDGNACTDKDACAAGKCAGKTKVCDDNDSCTKDSCDPKSGCLHVHDKDKPGCGGCKTFINNDFNQASDTTGWELSAVTPKPTNPQGKGWQLLVKAPSNGFKSASGALYYGDSAKFNYDWGKSQGHVLSPEITPTGDTVLKFWLRLEVEASVKYDAFQVMWITAAKQTVLLTREKPADNGAKLLNNQWQQITLPLGTFAGQPGRVAWLFAALDELQNTTRGAFLDDVVVTDCK